MRRILLLASLAFFLIPTTVRAQSFKASGTVKEVDADKSVLFIHAGGQDRKLPIANDAKFLGLDGNPLPDGLKAKELKEGAVVTIAVSRTNGGPTVTEIRLGGRVDPGGGKGPVSTGGKASYGFKPLNEMSADDKYKGEDGGLYGGGKNEPPAAHLAAAKAQTARIVPLDADGKPAADGKIGLVSISMSNATQEYSAFKKIADADPQKSANVAIVDCAQGGQAMAEWVDPKGRPWVTADQRLAQANVSLKQVQVVWVKLANKGPSGDLAEHGKKLQADTLAVLHNAKAHFPNLRIAYLGSRIYGGWSGGRLNPEPYAYEGAFAVRWLIQDQIKGDAELKFADASGSAPAPLLLWGPYFWADGTTPRKSDNLVWERADLGPDGTHPSDSGRQKVAGMLLKFFKEDGLAQTWFVKK
jgi:Cu/Ag efflux protein CusF